MGIEGATTYPSLAALSTREGITEYLATTFALADPSTAAALQEFLQHDDHGIFRGPFLRVRLPFLPVEQGWSNPLGWSPAGFRPYRHQARAFARLSTVTGPPEPTIVTTGTGSGKSEAFLLPLLDHARRARLEGQRGIKAIILYPMNALVTDQARRIAHLIHADPALSGVTAGVYIGGHGSHATMGPDHLVDRREEIRANPPDLLLTNYRMLDLLLLREADAGLWRSSATSLQFIVLDEFHTYDGAQGTDVAMLLRRLGATLGVAAPDRPIGRICPVATSATLGSGSRSGDLRAFAETVFGVPFDPESVVGEERHAVEDLFDDLDFDLHVPDVDAVLAAPLPDAANPLSWQPLAEVFLGHRPTDPVALGTALRRHILTRAVGHAIGQQPLSVPDALRAVAKSGALAWGAAASRDPGRAQEALLRFLTLLSAARAADAGGGPRPLVNVEVQLWVREVSRVLRELDEQPRFAWWSDGDTSDEAILLPAVYCRSCGSSGWQSVTGELGDSLDIDPRHTWHASLRDPERVRTLLPVRPGTPRAVSIDPRTGEVGAEPGLPVLMTPDERAARQQRCPACGADDAIRFLGSAVATLISVSLTQLFGLASVPESEKKTLVFTDSVQDAAFRAAFIEGRNFAFNFRSAVLRAVGDQPASLPDIAARLSASPTEDKYLIAPPDFVHRLGLTGEYLRGDAGRNARRLLATRLGFQAHLEVGVASRVGRTLELTGALGVHVAYDEDAVIRLLADIHANLPLLSAQPIGRDALHYWVQGLLDRVRSRGGITHPWLDTYVKEDGRRWRIWGGAARGMPQFPPGRAAPAFLTDRRSEAFDSITADTTTWLNDWTRRCLSLPTPEARHLLAAAVPSLAAPDRGPLIRTTTKSGAAAFSLDPAAIVLTPCTDDDATEGRMQLRCSTCNHIQPVSPGQAERWEGSPCPRMRCTGSLHRSAIRPDSFYRSLYRAGTLRRIVAAEHTGLLDRSEREAVEDAFKGNSSPVAPNVLACTPTLELGIDIGDLSSVTLSSLPRTPANYLQRVGRAGRSTGNALVLATVPTSPRDLYYFADPLTLIAGDVVPPSAYLEATELLARQYLAYCLDRIAGGAHRDRLPGGLPPQLGLLFHKPLEPGTWLRALTDLLTDQADTLCAGFLALFGHHLADSTRAAVLDYARDGLVAAIASTAAEWDRKVSACYQRVGELNAAITDLQGRGHLDDAQQQDLRAMLSERRAQLDLADTLKQQETLTGLSELSLLPNYNLLDDATTLDVSLWWTTEDEDAIQRADHSYRRGSRLALTEFAPGSTFYARSQKVTVDAVEVGPPANPTWTQRRLCPSCGWAADNAAPLPACPRCGDTDIADVGQLLRLLPFKEASAEHSRESAVIDDDGDGRLRKRFATVTTVDIDPVHVVRAWRLRDKAFGAEYARRATVRSINLGTLSDHSAAIRVGGERLSPAQFRICGYCGKWWKDGIDVDEVRHRGWCATRKGAPQTWPELVLSHELTTQAVRLLLPVSTFQTDSHLASMKGALLLGLRADFGGDPQHLDIVATTMPDLNGKPRRFLVLHDTVPGGTGYLDRIGDPERLLGILRKSRAQLADCPCRTEARLSCHRCLLAVLPGREIEHADRALAVTLLDELLSHWDVVPVDTVADVDIGIVHLSELEQRFRAAVIGWAATQGDGAHVSERMGPKGRELDLTITTDEGRTVRWHIQPLVDVVAGGVATQPDFLATRQDDTSARIAIYLDGKDFHASPQHNRTADDARKRAALRSAGYRVWSLTWDDVEDFTRAPGDAIEREYPDLVTAQISRAVLVAPPHGDADRARLLWGNPVRLLLAVLSDPESTFWADGTLALLHACARAARAQPQRLRREDLHADLVAAAVAQPPLPALTPGDDLVALRYPATPALPVVVFTTRTDPATTFSVFALLDDSDAAVGSPEHAVAWWSWLRWSNLAQFLPLPRTGQPVVYRSASFWSTGSLAHFDTEYLPLAHSAAVEERPELTPDLRVAIDLADPGLVSPLEDVAMRLVPEPVPIPEVGYEVADGAYMVELAWPDRRLAVVIDDDDERGRFLHNAGWTVLDGRRPGLADAIIKELMSP